MLLSFNVFLIKEKQETSFLGVFVLSRSHKFHKGQQEN